MTAAWTQQRTERSVFLSSGAGWMLDSMDISMFALVVPSLLAAFSISKGQAGILATAALLSSAFGGWLAGIVSDRIGRMLVLRVTIAWFSLATFACAFIHDYDVFLGMRIVQGFGFGGEWAVGAVLMAETVRSAVRGKIVGLVQSCYSIGWAVALLLFYLIFRRSSDPDSWRSFFIISGCLGLPLFLYRLTMRVPEISAPETARKPQHLGSFLEVFRRPYLRNTILATTLCVGFQSGAYCILVWLPTFLLSTRHLSILSTSSYLTVFVTGSFVGQVTAAYLSDVLGRRYELMAFSVAAFVMAVSYLLYPSNGPVMISLGFFLGFFVFGIYAAAGPLLSEIYPRRIRGAGQGFCYNVGRGVGAILPAVIGFISRWLGLGETITVFAGTAYFLTFVTAFLLPETTGVALGGIYAGSQHSEPLGTDVLSGSETSRLIIE